MINKRRIHHWLTLLRHVKVWQLLVVMVLLAGASVFALRQNNLQMVALRDAVKQTDEQNGDVGKALINLQQYVTSHMNTDLGNGIFLQQTYQRAYDAAVQAAVSSNNPNSKFYAEVEAECQPVFRRTGSFPAYTQCAHDKLAQLAPGQDALSLLKTPPTELFKHNYVSPVWSADVAGILLALLALVTVVLMLRIVGFFALRAIVKAKFN